MCLPIAALGLTAVQTFGLGASLAGTAISAKSAIDQGNATNKIAQNNAVMAGYAAADAQRKGEEDAQAIQRKGAALKSSQRVSMAAKGLDLGYGTAGDLQEQTDFFAASDVATARTNAGNDAWRYRNQGQDFRSQGAAAKSNGMMSAGGSLLSGASAVSDKWLRYKGY